MMKAEEEAGYKGEALHFAAQVKQDTTTEQNMMGAGAWRNTFFSFVWGYF